MLTFAAKRGFTHRVAKWGDGRTNFKPPSWSRGAGGIYGIKNKEPGQCEGSGHTRTPSRRRGWSYSVLTSSAPTRHSWFQVPGQQLVQTPYCLGHMLLGGHESLKTTLMSKGRWNGFDPQFPEETCLPSAWMTTLKMCPRTGNISITWALSPGHWSEVQILRPTPRPAESGFLGVGSRNPCLVRFLGDSDTRQGVRRLLRCSAHQHTGVTQMAKWWHEQKLKFMACSSMFQALVQRAHTLIPPSDPLM